MEMARTEAAAAPYLAILFRPVDAIEKAGFVFGQSTPLLPNTFESYFEARFDLLDFWSLWLSSFLTRVNLLTRFGLLL